MGGLFLKQLEGPRGGGAYSAGHEGTAPMQRRNYGISVQSVNDYL